MKPATALVIVVAAMVMVTTTTPVYGADAAGMTNEREKRNVAVFIKLLAGLTGLGQKLGLNRGSGSANKYGPNYGPRGFAFVNPAAYQVAPGAVYGSYGAEYAGAGYVPVPTAGVSSGTFPTAGVSFGTFPTAGVSFGTLPTAGEWDGPAPVIASPDANWPVVNPPTAVVYGPSPVHGPHVGGYD